MASGGGALRFLSRLFWGSRIDVFVRWVLLVIVVALAVTVPTTAVAVEYTARSEFCNSCHIMEPYYRSWQESGHSGVACIKCHYEPGTLETVEGKFKALSQLAKYVTRTAGTKPWAEVSDLSCLRSGCHSMRDIEGPIEFGRVKFDHRHHLLETRRGRRLRCTSCHSQIVQGQHVSVTESVCFMCHFMPGQDGEIPERTSDCSICHGPPDHVIDVAGEPFDHQEFLARGLDCQECHRPVVAGDGQVRRERCHSCHGEVGHIERIGETSFLHEKHVTEHKVECFECHDEIDHGLLPLQVSLPSTGEGCSACHVSPHDASRLVFAGTGAKGVADRPSRMFETRVVCEACHTGRTGATAADLGRGPHGGTLPRSGTNGHGGGLVAAAGTVDCIHCHGTGAGGMLAAWQAAVGGELERLGPLVDALGERLPGAAVGHAAAVAVSAPSESLETGNGSSADEARRLWSEARADLELVRVDGSRGAHNPPYAMDVLRSVAERADRAQALLDPSTELGASAGLPFVSKAGCSQCHLGMERSRPIAVHGRPFSHEHHVLEAELDCDTCHSTSEHGRPAFDRATCASCHHEEREDFDPWECGDCHQLQEDLLAGTAPGYDERLTGMEDKDCDMCHGEPPDIARPSAKLCQLCHDEEHAELLGTWQSTTEALTGELETALGAYRGGDAEAAEHARRALDLVRRDGSRGAHNFELIGAALREALDGL